ncbi:response regulator [Piscinibacter aquaticus]|uniref:Response regulator n=1 Tax=Piscinibacter aquaticus TaxID=392597 RepID=A0A5C6U4S8_9BURK|nr:response regulator [Piscinibacter aquaticus]
MPSRWPACRWCTSPIWWPNCRACWPTPSAPRRHRRLPRPMNRPRVLLVDDDPSIRRFVALALEDLDLELVEAGSVAQARERLAEGAGYALIVTDLMMPGRPGSTCCSTWPSSRRSAAVRGSRSSAPASMRPCRRDWRASTSGGSSPNRSRCSNSRTACARRSGRQRRPGPPRSP